MHSFVMVLVPADTQDVMQTVTEVLSHSDSNKEVEPHKVYVESEPLQMLAKSYGFIFSTDLPALAARMSETMATRYEIDEHGIFTVTTNNYQSCWDYWVIGGRWDGVIQGKSRNTKGLGNYGPEHEQLQYNICPVRELSPDVLPEVVVTPDGEWYEQEMRTIYPTPQEDGAWRKVMQPLLEQYQDCFAVGVDCHL